VPAAEPDKAGKADAAHMTDRPDRAVEAEPAAGGDKFPSSKIATKLGLKTAQFIDRATENGFLALDGDKHVLTAKGAAAGVEFVAKSRFGPYFLWPQDFHPA
jgi:hypothetical protein